MTPISTYISPGASVETVGGTFMIPCVVFTAVSLLAEDFMKRLGHKTVRFFVYYCLARALAPSCTSMP